MQKLIISMWCQNAGFWFLKDLISVPHHVWNSRWNHRIKMINLPLNDPYLMKLKRCAHCILISHHTSISHCILLSFCTSILYYLKWLLYYWECMQNSENMKISHPVKVSMSFNCTTKGANWVDINQFERL